MDKCPWIENCREKVTSDQYIAFCVANWIYCPEVPGEYKEKYYKLPKEWEEELKQEAKKDE